MTIQVTSGPQIQDFKVRNAITQISDYLSAITDLVSIGASPASTVTLTGIVANSIASSGVTQIAQSVLDIVNVLRTAKLMR